jgi:hypothetical protein
MKRLLVLALTTALTTLAFAQAPFTIVRPADGSKVRETIQVRFPKNSVPERGYVGIFVNGKFLEAVVPEVHGDFAVYNLDTKAKKIADGPVTIEAVLYQDQDTKTVVLDKSSVKVDVGNSSTINVPAEGLLLRYKFKPGTEYFYKLETRSSFSTISEAQLKLGGRAAELPPEADNLRLLYAIDDAYKTPNGREGLVRVQAFPPKSEDGRPMEYGWFRTAEGRQQFHEDDMVSLYMRLTDTGREVFGALAPYWPMEGTAGKGYDLSIIINAPLPVLPSKRVKPGDSWNAPFQGGQTNLEQVFTQTRFTTSFPARGELLGVEWMMGIPCAKIRTSTGVNLSQMGSLAPQGPDGASLGKVELEELAWFALDRGMVVRLERTFTQEMEVRREAAPQTGGGMAAGGPRGNNSGPQSQGFGGPGGGGGSQGIGNPDMFLPGDNIRQELDDPRRGGKGGNRQNSAPPAGLGGGGGQGGRTATGTGPKMFVRIKAQQVFILEK